MKYIVLFFSLIFAVSILYYACSQGKQITILKEGSDPIRLSLEYDNYANPEDLELKSGGIYAFQSEDGNDYAVIMRNANKLMEEVEHHFVVRANEIGAVQYFTVKEDATAEFIFEIYCITNNTVPDAPPRIVITVD